MRAASVAKMAWVMAGILTAGTASAVGGKTGPASRATSTPATTQPENSDNSEQPLTTGTLRATRQADKGVDEDQGAKAWDVTLEALTHHLLEDYSPCEPTGGSGTPAGGCGTKIATNELTFIAGYNLSQYDRFAASFSVVQSPIMDPGDDSVRADDMVIGYTRTVPLPVKLSLTLGIGTSIPTGYSAQLNSEITTPHASVGLSRRFGDLLLSGNTSFHYGIYRCRESGALVNGSSPSCSGEAGGVANQQWGAGGSLTADYTMPFLDALSAGVSVSTEYARAYMPGTAPTGGTGSLGGGSPQPSYAQGGAQPIQQGYGYEIFVRYVLPEVFGLRTDGSVAYAQGDPSLGYTQLTHDGIVQPFGFTPYLAYRGTSSVYATLSVRY